MNEIKVGDVVVLKSGGPLMTVDYIDDNFVYCVWFDGKEPKKQEFVSDILKLQEEYSGGGGMKA